MSDLEGGIELILAGDDDGRHRLLELHNRRPLAVTRLLTGLAADAALARVPLLWSVCAKAQSAAAGAALAAAQGRALPDGLGARVLGERLVEHVWRLALDWTGRLGLEPQPALVWAVRDAVRAGEPLPKPVLKALGTCFGQLLETLAARGLSGIGARSAWRPLPARPDWPALEAALGAAPAEAATFVLHPLCAGQPAETGPLVRQAASPVVARALERSGPCVATRLLALWMELRADWGRVQRGTGAAALLRVHSPRPGVGLAQVECARGTLTHRVALDGPLVTGWRVLAPTEWNFHPRGPLADAIATLPAQSDADATRAAETLAAALDPCVRIALRMTADA